MFSFKTDKIYARAITSIRHGMAENVFRISTTVAYIQACSLPGITGTPYPFNQRLVDKHENLRLIKYWSHLWALTSANQFPTQTRPPNKNWGGRALRHFGAEKHFCWWIDDTCDISDLREHIFCPQMTQELPKKDSEEWPPEQLPTDALSQIDYGLTRHCEDCLCRWTMQRAFWKIWVGVCV